MGEERGERGRGQKGEKNERKNKEGKIEDMRGENRRNNDPPPLEQRGHIIKCSILLLLVHKTVSPQGIFCIPFGVIARSLSQLENTKHKDKIHY